MIYNEDKTEILNYEDLDFEKGHLVDDTLEIKHDAIVEVEESGHYEVLQEYDNGGKDLKYVIDVERVEPREAYTETVQIQKFVEYTGVELVEMQNEKRLTELKNELASTDYEALKYAEGWYTDEEYADMKAHREFLREQIRAIIDE